MSQPPRRAAFATAAVALAIAACASAPEPTWANADFPFVPADAERQLVAFTADTLPDWVAQQADGTTTTRRIHASVRRPLQLLLRADRAITVAIPAMRACGSTVPDRLQSLWFVAARSGEFEVHVHCGSERFDGVLVVTEPGTSATPPRR
ncbi:MAG: hypothetical protein JNK15_25950 [Planctomycetes bacterium]|nr:hypothetical protein [Planctomycetota bacterium]